MSRLFGPDFITQRYLRQYPDSLRAKSWAGVMVHIETENGVWRTGGSGYTWAGKPDAWIIPFEQAVRQIEHCGPEKCGKFLRAQTPTPSSNEGPAAYRAKNPDGDGFLYFDGDGAVEVYRMAGVEITPLYTLPPVSIQGDHITPQMLRDTAAWCQSEDELRETLKRAAEALEASTASNSEGIEAAHTVLSKYPKSVVEAAISAYLDKATPVSIVGGSITRKQARKLALDELSKRMLEGNVADAFDHAVDVYLKKLSAILCAAEPSGYVNPDHAGFPILAGSIALYQYSFAAATLPLYAALDPTPETIGDTDG